MIEVTDDVVALIQDDSIDVISKAEVIFADSRHVDNVSVAAGTESAQGRADIIAFGDSVTEGGGANTHEEAWPYKLQQLLRAAYPGPNIGTAGGIGYRPAQNAVIAFTDPTTTGAPTEGFYGYGRKSLQLPAFGDTVTWTGITADVVRVWHPWYSGHGSIKIEVDGPLSPTGGRIQNFGPNDYVWSNGVTNANTVSSTGIISLQAYVEAADWTPTQTTSTICGWQNTVRMELLGTGSGAANKLNAAVIQGGTGKSCQTTANIGTTTGWADGAGGWLRADINFNTDQVSFYYSNNAKSTARASVTWTLIEAKALSATVTGTDSVTSAVVGNQTTTVGNAGWLGKIYKAAGIIATAVGAGPTYTLTITETCWDVDFTKEVEGARFFRDEVGKRWVFSYLSGAGIPALDSKTVIQDSVCGKWASGFFGTQTGLNAYDDYTDIELDGASHSIRVSHHCLGSGLYTSPGVDGIQVFDEDQDRPGYLIGSTSSWYQCPDTSYTSIVGDLDVRVRVRATDYTAASAQTLAAKWDSLAGNNRAWRFSIDAAGTLSLTWSTNGTATVTATSNQPSFKDGKDYWLRATIDVDNGSAQNVVNFYRSEDNTNDHTAVTWTLINTVTTAGATSIFNSPAVNLVGAIISGTPLYFTGRIYAVAVIDDTTSNVVMNPDFTQAIIPGGGDVIDDAGNVWVNGGFATVPLSPARSEGIQVIQAGHSGYQATHFDIGLEGAMGRQVSLTDAPFVFLWFGFNEFGNDIDPDVYKSNMQLLIDGGIRLENTDTKIVLIVSWEADNGPHAFEWSEYVEKLYELYTENPNMYIIDFSDPITWPQPGTTEGTASGYYFDTTHPNATGYTAVAQYIFDNLQDMDLVHYFDPTYVSEGTGLATYDSFFAPEQVINGSEEETFEWLVLDSIDENGDPVCFNGRYHIMDDEVKAGTEYGWWTTGVSDGSGTLATPESVEVTFDVRKANYIKVTTSYSMGRVSTGTLEYKANGVWVSHDVYFGGDWEYTWDLGATVDLTKVKFTVLTTEHGNDVGRIHELIPLYMEIFDDDDIINFNVDKVRENTDSANPVGSTAANTLSITFENTVKDWNPYGGGQWSDYVEPDIIIRPYVAFEEEAAEYIPLGEYYADTIEVSEEMTATVSCRDYSKYLQEFNVEEGIFHKDIPVGRAIGHAARTAGIPARKIQYMDDFWRTLRVTNPVAAWTLQDSPAIDEDGIYESLVIEDFQSTHDGVAVTTNTTDIELGQPSIIPSKKAHSVKFNAVAGKWIEIDDHGDLDLTDGLTILGTLQPEAGDAVIVSKGAAYQVGITASNELTLTISGSELGDAIDNRDNEMVKFLAVGDSITEGWDATVPANRWINRFQTGMRTHYTTTGIGSGGGYGYMPFDYASTLFGPDYLYSQAAIPQTSRYFAGMDGNTGRYVTANTGNVNTATATLKIIAYATSTDWTPANQRCIGGYRDVAYLTLETDGKLKINVVQSNATARSGISTAANGITDVCGAWIGVSIDTAAKTASFYKCATLPGLIDPGTDFTTGGWVAVGTLSQAITSWDGTWASTTEVDIGVKSPTTLAWNGQIGVFKTLINGANTFHLDVSNETLDAVGGLAETGQIWVASGTGVIVTEQVSRNSSDGGYGYRRVTLNTGSSIKFDNITCDQIRVHYYNLQFAGTFNVKIDSETYTHQCQTIRGTAGSYLDDFFDVWLGTGTHDIVIWREGNSGFQPFMTGVTFYDGDGPERYADMDGVDRSFGAPDAAALDILGDIDLRGKVAMNDYTSTGVGGSHKTIISKWNAFFTNQRSYALAVNSAGELIFEWSVDGTNGLSATSSGAALVDGTDYWLRATMDVDDGAGNRVIRFYKSTDATMDHTAVAWTLISTTTTAGVTSIFNSTSGINAGQISWFGAQRNWPGKMYACAILNGIAGTTVANPRWDKQGKWSPDTIGNVWTCVGESLNTTSVIFNYYNDKGITVYDAGHGGAMASTFANGAFGFSDFYTDMRDWTTLLDPTIVLLALGTNEWQNAVSRTTYKNNMQTIIDELRFYNSTLPFVLIAWPEPIAAYGNSVPYSEYVDVMQELYENNTNMGFIDFYNNPVAGVGHDGFGLHPSDAQQQVVADYLVEYFSVGAGDQVVTSDPITLNESHFFVARAGNGTLSMDVDGQHVEKFTGTISLDTNANDLLLGAGPSGDEYDGYLQGVGLYDKAITDREALQLYYEGRIEEIFDFPYLYSFENTLWEGMLEWATADIGIFFFDEYGNFIYEYRNTLHDEALTQHSEIQYTFDEDTDIIGGSHIADVQTNRVTVTVNPITTINSDVQSVWRAEEGESLVVTKLRSIIDEDDTEILVKSTTEPLWLDTGYLKIDDEIMGYSSKSGNKLLGLTRGQFGTTAAQHGTKTYSFESSLEGFHPTRATRDQLYGNCELIRSSAQAHDGSGSIKATVLLDTVLDAEISGPRGKKALPVTNGSTTITFWIYSATAARTVRAGVRFFNIDEFKVDETYGTQSTSTLNGWKQYSVTFTPSGTKKYMTPLIYITGPSDGDVFYVDEVKVTNTRPKVREVRYYEIDYDQSPVIKVQFPHISAAIFDDTVKIESFEANAFGAKILVSATNTAGVGDTIILEGTDPISEENNYFAIAGIPLVEEQSNNEVKEESAELAGSIRRHRVHELTVDNKFIQNAEYARVIAQHLIEHFAIPVPVVNLTTMGVPMIQLGDRISIGAFDQLSAAGREFWVLSTSISYDGGLNQTFILREVS